jgi:UDP-GlcNAc:undecaprenyl-phosphate GlcNAc-1-phosphate transferase
VYGGETISLSALILDWMIVTGAVGGTRFGFRALRQYFAAQRDDGRRVFVYGSTDQGLLVVRHLRQRAHRTVVGLLDDDETRHSLRVQGVGVLGGTDDLPQLVKEQDVDEVIVPVQGTPRDVQERLARRCEEAGIDCQHFAFRLESPRTGEALPPSAGDGARTASPSS